MYLYRVTYKIIEEQLNFIQVVTGPRQVGKTTMILQLLKNTTLGYTYEAADAILNSNSEWILQVWKTARLNTKASQATDYLLVIDEVQKIDNWSEIVKQQWDRDSRCIVELDCRFTEVRGNRHIF